jgi:hypothetical protein
MLNGKSSFIFEFQCDELFESWWTELVSRPAWVKLVAEGIKGTIN